MKVVRLISPGSRLGADLQVARDTMAATLDQLLDQLSARSLVLNQHDGRIEQALLLAYGALERRIFEPPAENTEEEEVLAAHSPSRAHREIAEFRRLVGGVPALHDAVEALRSLALAVALEPFGFHHAAAQWRGRLLILSGEVVFADGPPDVLKGFERLT